LTPAAAAWLLDRGKGGSAAPPPSEAFTDLPADSRLVVLVHPSPHHDLEATSLAYRSMTATRGVPVFAVLRNLDLLKHPDWFPDDAAAAREVQSLSVFIRHASGVIANSLSDAAYVSSFFPTSSRSGEVVVAQRRTPLTRPPAEPAGAAGLTLILGSRQFAETMAMYQGWRMGPARNGRAVVIGPDAGSLSVEALRNRLVEQGGGADQVDVIGPDPELVRKYLQTASFCLVPRARPDADLWVFDALQAGATVIASVEGDAFTQWGALVSDYVDFRDTQKLVDRWTRLLDQTRTADSPAMVPRAWLKEPWSGQVTAAALDLNARLSPARYDRAGVIEMGVFYRFSETVSDRRSMKTTDTGLPLRLGRGWNAPDAIGSSFGRDGGRLDIKIDYYLADKFACHLALSSRASSPQWLSLRLKTNSEFHTQRYQISPRRNWRWTKIEFSLPAFQQSNVLIDIVPEPSEGDAAFEDCAIAVAGLVVTPVDMPHYWDDLFRQAAAGFVPKPRNSDAS
jgi:hypothetical protein